MQHTRLERISSRGQHNVLYYHLYNSSLFNSNIKNGDLRNTFLDLMSIGDMKMVSPGYQRSWSIIWAQLF